MIISIDHEKCVKCGACAAVCPAIVIEKSGDGSVEFKHADSCIRCYHCVAVCPSSAVECDEFSLEEFKKIPATKPPSAASVRNLLLSRRSVREFKDKEVPREILEELVALAACAPTGHNDRAVNFSVVTDKKTIDKIDARIFKMFDSLAKVVDAPMALAIIKTIGGEKTATSLGNLSDNLGRFKEAEGARGKMVFRGAPVLVVAHTGPGATTGRDDSLIALTHMMIAANAHGLGATWIGFLVGAAKIDPTIKGKLGVPMKNTIHAAMILGWPKHKYKRFIPRKVAGVKWID